MNFLKKIRQRLHKEQFLPTLLGLITNPVFIIRKGLYREIKKFSPLIKGKILDFGCGSKPYETLFSSATAYIGIDIEDSGHFHKNSKIDYFYDGENLPFNDAEFNTVVSFETFEHIFNLPTILSEINRVTQKSGYLLISIPFAWGEHEAPYDYARYTSFGINDILNKSGYKIIELKKSNQVISTSWKVKIDAYKELREVNEFSPPLTDRGIEKIEKEIKNII